MLCFVYQDSPAWFKTSGLLGQSWETVHTRQKGVPSEDLGLSSANPQPDLGLALFIFPIAEED